MKYLLRTTLYILAVLLPTITFALERTDQNLKTFTQGIEGLVNEIIFFIVAGSLVMFLWGLAMSMNKESQKQIEDSKNIMIWGVIGLVVMGSIYGIVNLLTATVEPIISVPTRAQ